MTPGTRVIHNRHPEYGFGIVKLVEENALGEIRCQVSFDHLDRYEALPLDDLKAVKTPSEAFVAGELGTLHAAKRKLAAGMILGENNLTGAFLRVAIQPLPHQAFLLEKVISKSRLGHMLADDVGLGKTIEAGLIVSSILQQPLSADRSAQA